MEFLHSKQIAHRDLKPENLLLDKFKNLKIVDFGLSNTYKQGELLQTACGSPCYAAPEMIAGKRYNGIEVDIWSSGVTLYAMLCGYLPFEDPDTAILYRKILKGDFELPEFLSSKAQTFLKGLLCTDPKNRLTLDKIKKSAWYTY
jgi:5'-AMP-activated protein kinase, catalytic alpha subunit